MTRPRWLAAFAFAVVVISALQTLRTCRLQRQLERAEQYAASGTFSWFTVCMQVDVTLRREFETREAQHLASSLANACIGHHKDLQQHVFDALLRSETRSSQRLLEQHLWNRLDAHDLPLVFNYPNREMLPKGYR